MERLLRQDWVIRILSLILAFVLWLNVTSDRVTLARKTFQLPVKVENLGPDLQLQSPERQLIEITLNGPKRDLDRIGEQDLEPYVDLNGLEPGYYPLPVKLRNQLPEGVAVDVSPNVVYVRIERHVVKSVPVVLPRSEIYRDQVKYVLELEESTTTLTGQQSLVDRVVRVEARVDVTNAQNGETRTAHLVALDAGGAEVTGIGVTPATLPVDITVVQLPPAKQVPVRPKFTGSLPDGYTFSVSVTPATVRVRGPRDRHDQWQEVATEPIDLTDQTKPFIYQVALVKPDGAESIDAEVATVSINITEQIVDRTYTDLPVGLWHLASNLQAQLAAQTATVRIRGTKRFLDTFDPSGLSLHIDAQDLGPGKHLVPIRYNKPEQVEILSVDPSAIEVTITPVAENTESPPVPRQ